MNYLLFSYYDTVQMTSS